MRSDLAAISGIAEVVTNVDQRTCRFEIQPGIDVALTMEALAEKNNKVNGWVVID